MARVRKTFSHSFHTFLRSNRLSLRNSHNLPPVYVCVCFCRKHSLLSEIIVISRITLLIFNISRWSRIATVLLLITKEWPACACDNAVATISWHISGMPLFNRAIISISNRCNRIVFFPNHDGVETRSLIDKTVIESRITTDFRNSRF